MRISGIRQSYIFYWLSIAVFVLVHGIVFASQTQIRKGAMQRIDSAVIVQNTVYSMQEFRRQHVVLQQWEFSCAAAALATILRYQYGLPITERIVALGMIKRKEYIANPELLRNRQGFSLLDLKRYADSLGFEGRGMGQLSYADLVNYAPIIVPMINQGYPHFVVFRGATSNSVLIADPAFGNVTMPVYKFNNRWIKYKDINHVGFVVMHKGKLAAPGALSPQATEFTTSP